MRPAHWLGTALGAGTLAWFIVQHASPTSAALPEPAPLPAPAVVLLEGPPEGTTTDVVVRAPGGGARLLGRVVHAAGSAVRGAVVAREGRSVALVVAAEGETRGAGSYHSALFRVEGGSAMRLLGEVADASAPLVTARGTVLVQRGRDGEEPLPGDTRGPLRERTDALSLDAVDLATGAVRTVWSGAGQIAFLAAALRGDDALIYHVDDAGARLLVLDAATGATRVLLPAMLPLARDFSYDAARDELVFARAAAYGSTEYEVVRTAVYAGPAAPAVVYRGANDHLMPRVLSGGVVAFSLPGDQGLALLEGAQARRVAPLGEGSDAALAESPDRRWLVVRHTDPQREVLGLVLRATGAASQTLHRPDTYVEFAGFAAEVAR
jgi:hypothetical protein